MVRPLGVLLALLIGVGSGSAQVDSAQERARQLFSQGSAYLKEGKFALAVAAFEQANAIKPHPVMLKNIARTYQSMEDLVRSIDYFKQYLAANPKDAKAIEAVVAELEATLAGWPRITVDTRPPGASVWIDDRNTRPRGTTPATVPVAPGTRTLIIGLGGHDVVERAVRVEAKQTLTLPTIMLQARLPALVVKSDPPGARIRFDDQPEAGMTPFTGALAAGEHTAHVELDGFVPGAVTFTLTARHTPDKPLSLTVTLEKARPTGELMVEFEGAGEIHIDGKKVAQAPMTTPVRVEAGLHTLQIKTPGRDEPYQEMVTIEAGALTRTRIEAEAAGGGFSLDQGTVSWGLMGLGGALVLGGVVTSVLAVGADGDLKSCRDDPACDGTDQEVSLADDVRSQALTTDILIGVGAAVAATGVVLYLLDDDAPETRAEAKVTGVGLTPIRGGGAAAVRFEF